MKITPTLQERINTRPLVYLVRRAAKWGVVEYRWTGGWHLDNVGRPIPLVYDIDDHNGEYDDCRSVPITATVACECADWSFSERAARLLADALNRANDVPAEDAKSNTHIVSPLALSSINKLAANVQTQMRAKADKKRQKLLDRIVAALTNDALAVAGEGGNSAMSDNLYVPTFVGTDEIYTADENNDWLWQKLTEHFVPLGFTIDKMPSNYFTIEWENTDTTQ